MFANDPGKQTVCYFSVVPDDKELACQLREQRLNSLAGFCERDGEGEELWNDNPHKKCHKDIDARWTVKRRKTEYRYKEHAKVYARTKMVLSYDTTSANAHDSREVITPLPDDGKGKTLYADAGYRSHPLTEGQKADNREKSKVRSRVEHVFGFMEQGMRGLVVRTVGLALPKEAGCQYREKY